MTRSASVRSTYSFVHVRSFAHCAIASAILVAILSSSGIATGDSGVLGQSAPKLWANAWWGLDTGRGEVDLASQHGKVVHLTFFQSWCPGCLRNALPTLVELSEHYRADEAVVFLAVQAVFEGFRTNDADAAIETIERFGLQIPVGHDAGPDNNGSITMRRYRSRGTPWTVVIDREGLVRFNNYHLDTDAGIRLIDSLLAK